MITAEDKVNSSLSLQKQTRKSWTFMCLQWKFTQVTQIIT